MQLYKHNGFLGAQMTEMQQHKKIFVKTYGCSRNYSDSETMAHYLLEAGYEITGIGASDLSEEELISDADLVIVNTCTVKNPTEDKFFSFLKKLSNLNKIVVVAGCISQSEKGALWMKNYSVIGLDVLDNIVEIVDKTLAGEIVHNLARKQGPWERPFLPTLRHKKVIVSIPILSGCLGNCTYCKTKFARGHLRSATSESIIEQIKTAVEKGIKEIWLVSEDNGAYGIDIGTTLPELLKLIENIPGDFFVRIGMLNPDFAYKYRNELAEIKQSPRFFTFLHIPIQAADDNVLENMKRPYAIEEFEEAVSVLKEKNPNMTLATDIICGYPSETEEQWNVTMNFLKNFKFNAINISKFYPRRGTVAAKMKLIPTQEVKRRSKELSDWFETQNYNEDYVGKTLSVFVDEKGKKEGSFIGRLQNYKQVIVMSDIDLIGQRVLVKVESTTRDDLRGSIITQQE